MMTPISLQNLLHLNVITTSLGIGPLRLSAIPVPYRGTRHEIAFKVSDPLLAESSFRRTMYFLLMLWQKSFIFLVS